MKRVRYFDLLRVVCFCMIIFYHMMVQLYLSGMFAIEYVNPYFSNVNMHIATLSVAVFFMLSGAGLMISTKDKIDYKKFYIKRFLRLLIPFYIVNIIYIIYRAIMARTIYVLDPNIAPWKIILGIFGLDGWLTLYKIPSYSQGIGEWFLGCLIVLYLLFPLFRKLMLKYKVAFLAIVAALYVFLIYTYSSEVAVFQNIFVKGCEFIFGMYLGLYWERVNKKWAILTLPVCVFFFTSKTYLPINLALSITIFAVAFFLTFSFIEEPLQKSKFLYKIIAYLSGCSYELFLIHHIIIYNMTPALNPYIRNNFGVLLLFIAELVAMAVLTPIVKFICDKVVFLLQKLLLGKNKN